MTIETHGTFITALGTPLTSDEALHEEGLAAEIADQWNHGIDGLLVAGTMGAMQLLTDEVYRQLIRRAVELSRGKGEILVGAGDAGYTRTRERIRFINEHKVDGVAVLAPFFWNFDQQALIEYYRALADDSKAPLFLYDLPVVTGTKLEQDTVVELAKHPNIRGIKASCDFALTRQLIDALDDPAFRVIVAQPDIVDVLLRHGIRQHLDGMWAIAPEWSVSIARCGAANDWESAAAHQRNLSALRRMIRRWGFAVFTELMNARGIPGRFAPRPHQDLSPSVREALLNDDTVRKLLQDDPAK